MCQETNAATLPQQAQKTPKEVVYMSGNEEVKLSKDIVRSFLINGDQSKVTDTDIVLFIKLCQCNRLNPFIKEAFLVKYGTAPAQMIVSKEAMLKRAENCPHFEGIQAGIIVADQTGEIKQLEGCFVPANHTLVGGWAKVYRDDRKFPVVSTVNVEEYDKKQSTWNTMKSTMIAKVAKVQALREAFPTQFGAMYIEEEAAAIDDQGYAQAPQSVEDKKAAMRNSENKPEKML